jgi:hypothetical protein
VAGLARATDAGSYIDSLSGATGSGLANYAIGYVNGSLTIDRAPLTLTYTASAARSAYGAGLSTLGGTVSGSGFVSRDGLGSLTGSPLWRTTATTGSNVGNYAIIGSGLGSGNYAITPVQAGNNASAYTIDPASLTITANSAARRYDATAFTRGSGVTPAGLVNHDTLASLTGTLTYGGSAQGAVDIGTYQITASGLTSSNYVIDWQPGTLLIIPFDLQPLPSLYRQAPTAPAWMSVNIDLDLGIEAHGEKCRAAPVGWTGQASMSSCSAN